MLQPPKFRFIVRTGPVRLAIAYLPTRMYDGKWIWMQAYLWSKYVTKADLDGKRIDHRIRWNA